MANIITQLVNEQGIVICANVDCGKPMEGYNINSRQRFCKRCRISYNPIRWKCRGCNAILSNSENRESRQFCDFCSGKARVE